MSVCPIQRYLLHFTGKEILEICLKSLNSVTEFVFENAL